jgi:tryptophan halogenase
MSKITIIGSGLSGHFTAMTLQAFYPEYEYEIINDINTPTIGVGESGIPDLPVFLFDYAKIDINEFYHEVHPIHKMGINFRNWVKTDFNYNYTFDSGMVKNAFNKNEYILGSNDTTFACHLIENNLSPITSDFSIYGAFSYQIDNLKFVNFLKKNAIKRGITYINKKIIDIEFEKDKKIKNLILEDNQKHCADFYIDCSGFKSIIAQKIKTKFISFKDKLPCDYAVVGQHEIDKEEIKSYTVSTRKPAGWQWEIDTSERAGKGYVYCSNFISQEMAVEQFMLDNPKIKTPRIIPFPSGRYDDMCGENYFLNGNAQGFAEPLESTGFSITLLTVKAFLSIIKDDLILNNTKQKLFNNYVKNFWNGIVNFLVLHYKYNDHINNNGFWEYCQNEIKLSDNINFILEYCQENETNKMSDEHLVRYLENDPIFNLEGVYVHANSRNMIKYKPNLYFKNQILEDFKQKRKKFLKETQLIDFNYQSIDFSHILKNRKNYLDLS